MDPTPRLGFATRRVQLIAPTYGAVSCWGGLIIFLLNNLKFPTVVQQIKSIGVSLWVGTEHWHVLVSASRLSERGLAQILPVLTCDHNGASCHNSHQMTWHQAKPAHINECKSFKMSHCSGRFEFRLHMTPKDNSWFNNLSCHFNLHPYIILGTS